MALYVNETFINATKGWVIGVNEEVETSAESTGELFRSMRDEYGKCVSKLYIDTADGHPRQIGWVFESRQRYTDAHRGDRESSYIREVCVEVLDSKDTVTRKRHYHDFKATRVQK